MPAGNVNAMGSAIPAAVDASAAVARGVVQGVAQGVAQGVTQGAKAAGDFFGGVASGIASAMGAPSGTTTPVPDADPSATAAMQGATAADSDPGDSFFDDMFSDEPDAGDQSSLGAAGGGAMPGAGGMDASGAQQALPGTQGLPVAAGPNGQAVQMTGQGALPPVMTQQGPMAMTPSGAVPLQAPTGQGAQPQRTIRAQARALQQQARQAQQKARRAQALSELAARLVAAASPSARAPNSGVSYYAPPKKAPVVLTAPVRIAPAVNPKTAPTTAKADPRLAANGGGGTRIGTTGTGDGNIR